MIGSQPRLYVYRLSKLLWHYTVEVSSGDNDQKACKAYNICYMVISENISWVLTSSSSKDWIIQRNTLEHIIICLGLTSRNLLLIQIEVKKKKTRIIKGTKCFRISVGALGKASRKLSLSLVWWMGRVQLCQNFCRIILFKEMAVREPQRWETPCMCKDYQADQLVYVLLRWAQIRSVGILQGSMK